ncbi:MAG TPA: hypothetical protein CFH82_09130 [Sulfurospirillum sp. UBA12182]|nr:MAG TPA: hypothetical protein CFH82_09130 [Sulfurospirillum sp. UBA12182]
MILSFEFHYVSQNGVLENLLKSICEDFEIDYSITKNSSIVSLFVNANEEQLGAFSDFLSNRLPLSIFFKSSSVSVVEKKEENTVLEDCKLTLPFTPKTLALVTDEKSQFFMTPFVANEIGNVPFSNGSKIELCDNLENTLLLANDKFQELYEGVAKLLKEGKKVLIHSSSGSYIYSQVASQNKATKDSIVIATDLSVVEKMVVIKENEIKAIASLEKPAIRLKVNSLYATKGILSQSRVKLKLADDLLIKFICDFCFKEGIEFLSRIEQNEDFDFVLKTDATLSQTPQIEVCVLENGEILIVSGDGYSAPLVKENLKKFENPAHAQFTSVIQERDLFAEQSSCFYLSKTHEDKFMHLSKQTGMLDLVSFPVEKDFEKIFEKIKESSTGEKLLENYTQKFPELVDNALKIKIPQDAPNSIYTMWGICSVLLGFSQTYENAAEKLIENAEDYGGQKGPRVDYPLFDSEALVSNFNFIKMIRSAMSFKLAGTDDNTLSFGFLESLSYFLSDSADFYKENLSSQRIILCGSLFGIRRLSELSSRNILASSKLSFNRELPIDN